MDWIEIFFDTINESSRLIRLRKIAVLIVSILRKDMIKGPKIISSMIGTAISVLMWNFQERNEAVCDERVNLSHSEKTSSNTYKCMTGPRLVSSMMYNSTKNFD